MSEQWGLDPIMPRNDVVDVVGQQTVYPPVPARRVPAATVTQEFRLTDEDVERVAERVWAMYFEARYEECRRVRQEHNSSHVCDCQSGRECPIRDVNGQRVTV